MDSNENTMKAYYSQLIGFKIVDFRFERDEFGDDEGWPIFTVRVPRGKNPETRKTIYETVDVVVSRDPEGNGGGFLFLEECSNPRFVGGES